MGREIVNEDEDCDIGLLSQTRQLEMDGTKRATITRVLSDMKTLSPGETRILFETLFSRMTSRSKEAMTEILWSGLDPSEQEAFELPYFGQRWSDESITRAFNNAFVSRPSNQRQSPALALIQRGNTAIGASPSLFTPPRRPLSDHTAVHTFSGGTSTNSQTTRGNQRSTGMSTQTRAAATSNSDLSRVIENDLTNHMEMEEQFFSILREAISRAERQSSFPTRRNTSTRNTDPNNGEMDDEL